MSVGLNVGLNIPLIMWYGAIGAAWATMLAGLTSGTISLLVAQHYYRVHYEWNKIAWIMGTFFIGSTIIVFMNILNTPYEYSLIIKLLFFIMFIFIGRKYRIITMDNFFEIRKSFLNKISISQ